MLKKHKVMITGGQSTQEEVVLSNEEEQNLLEEWAQNVVTPEQVEKENAQRELQQSDKHMARIAEDVINLLISKGMFSFVELPQSVQDILNERQALRAKLTK